MDDEHDEREGDLYHLEGGVPVFERLDNVERKQAEAESREETYKQQQLSINKRMMYFSGALVLLAVVGGAINGCYTWITRKTADAAKISAEAAKRSADTAHDTLLEIQKSGTDTHDLAVAAGKSADAAQRTAKTASDTLANSQKAFELDERPYVVMYDHPEFVPPGLSPNQKIIVNGYLKNIGKSSAIQQITEAHLFLQPIPDGDPFSKEAIAKNRQVYNSWFNKMRGDGEKLRAEYREFPSGHGEDMAPEDNSFFSVGFNDNVVLNPVMLNFLTDTNNPKLYIFLVVVSTYTDRFGKSYETDACRVYWGSNPSIWHRCGAYNSIK